MWVTGSDFTGTRGLTGWTKLDKLSSSDLERWYVWKLILELFDYNINFFDFFKSDCVTVKPAAEPSIYEGIGGKAALDLAVDKFYDKVLKDNRVKHFFKNTDMKN